MIEGMPASSSIAVPTGPRIHFGAISVRNIAMPKLTGTAMIIAVPVSFGIAMFLTEIAPKWMRGPVGTAIELLAGIPSIIYGMWGLFVLVPVLAEHVYPWIDAHMGTWPVIGTLFAGPPLGLGMLTAGLVLAIMVIPFIASVMREVFLTVPGRLKESSYALGSTRWEVAVSYTHLRAHETGRNLVCRLLLEKKKK